MGIVRKHPFLSMLVAVLLTPAFLFGGLLVAQRLPACSEWRAEVEKVTDSRMTTRYLGDGDAQAFDYAYRHWDTTFRETRKDVRAQVAMERAGARPGLCL